MPISLAQGALIYAKMSTPLGTDNKGFGQLSPIQPGAPVRDGDTRIAAMQAVTDVKAFMPPRGCAMDDVLAYGRRVGKHGAGNCLEQSAAAAVYLSGQADSPYFNLVELEDPGDHIFVVLNQRPDNAGKYPDSFADWDDDAIIIDPWVDLTCKAKHYPAQWKIKLAAFAAVGGELAGKNGRAKASDSSWMNALTANGKKSFCA